MMEKMKNQHRENTVRKTLCLSEAADTQLRMICFNRQNKQYRVIEDSIALFYLLLKHKPDEFGKLLDQARKWQESTELSEIKCEFNLIFNLALGDETEAAES